jgi:hypothetical protein
MALKLMKNRLKFFLKKMVFAFLRIKQPITLYDDRLPTAEGNLRVCHIGDPQRGEEFIRQLYGKRPFAQAYGKRIVWPRPKTVETAAPACDILLVEINRLFIDAYRRAGFFAIPEWVEFGRTVVKDSEERYKGAEKSLKSDLNKIRRTDCSVEYTRTLSDFEHFYNEMYLPHVLTRFGEGGIVKSKREMQKQFETGFLLMLKYKDKPVAGALVKIDQEIVTERAIGVLHGMDEILKSGVSGIIDYYLHQWAAENDKSFINVGHTRPFPLDGVFFNKRKWQMAIFQDHDGVMNMAMKFNIEGQSAVSILDRFPFVFQTQTGLGLICSFNKNRPLLIKDLESLLKRYATAGLESMIVISPGGADEEVTKFTERYQGVKLNVVNCIKRANKDFHDEINEQMIGSNLHVRSNAQMSMK